MLTSLAFGYFLSAVAVSLISFGRRISFTNALTISIFLTPIIGLITVLNIGRSLRVSRYITKYQCPQCKKEFTEPHFICPQCEEKKLQIDLHQIKHLQIT
ncbi:MAG: hypothetical protein A2W85_08675 [Bacteroidetes bacterium GWF2_41_31]|nr:MAG: hypothetical protein A2W85_08675 [Bacteroidetes bacterium GWF2_41_31]